MSQQHDILASLQEVDLDAGTVFSELRPALR